MSEDALHRDDPAGVLLPRTINNSHPAATYLLQNFVMTEPPVGVGHIRFCENALKCFPRRFAFGFGSFVQETVDARLSSFRIAAPQRGHFFGLSLVPLDE